MPSSFARTLHIIQVLQGRFYSADALQGSAHQVWDPSASPLPCTCTNFSACAVHLWSQPPWVIQGGWLQRRNVHALPSSAQTPVLWACMLSSGLRLLHSKKEQAAPPWSEVIWAQCTCPGLSVSQVQPAPAAPPWWHSCCSVVFTKVCVCTSQ